MIFEPDYSNIVDAANNIKPKRLPLYEHIISPHIMEKILELKFAELQFGNQKDMQEFFRNFCRFFKKMTYDTVSFEVCITSILPDNGAITGGKPGPIQNRKNFESYPWDELPQRYWTLAEKQFQALVENLPVGMKAVGGIGNGVFEISEDLVGYEYLSYMLVDDPKLVHDLYDKIGELMLTVWHRFLKQFGKYFCICRFGDDLGYKTGLLMSGQRFCLISSPSIKK